MAQENSKYSIPDNIYLLLNEKTAIRNITRKNNNYTRTSLIRLLEINGELTSFYIDVGDGEEINIIYNESYEIIEYLRNFNRESEFYPSGIVRFAYILYKIKEYKACLEYLEAAKANKYLTEDSYVFAVKIAAQVHYELSNFQNVIDQFNLIKDKYYDKLDDDILLVYAKALLKRQNFALAYDTLIKFIKSVEGKNKKFTKSLLDTIHIFFVEANKIGEGIRFLSKYAPNRLPTMSEYIFERKKGVSHANQTFKQYTKLEKDHNTYFKHLLTHLNSLKKNGYFRHMGYFMKVGANLLTKKTKATKIYRQDFINILFLTLDDHVKYNIIPIYTRRLSLILKNSFSGFDAHLDFILAKQYFRNFEYRKAYRYFDQAYRLASSGYKSREGQIPEFQALVRSRKDMTKQSLDYMYVIYSQKIKKLLAEDESKELLENYNKDNPKGKYINNVFLSLVGIYLDLGEFDLASVTINDYLNRFPKNIDIYRDPIEGLVTKVNKEPDQKKQNEFLQFIKSEDFQQKIFRNRNDLSKLAKAEYLFKLGLYQEALGLIQLSKISDFKKPEEKNRFLFYSARIHLKNFQIKESSKLLIEYISRAERWELEKFNSIIIDLIEEFYNLQDIITPYEVSRRAFKSVNSSMASFPKYISTYLFAMIMNKKNSEFIDFIKTNENVFSQEVVNDAFKKLYDFLMLNKNTNILVSFIKLFADKIELEFEQLENINNKFHDLIINNKLKTAKKFQAFMLKNIERFSIKDEFKTRIYDYYKLRDLLYATFKEDIIQWNFEEKDPQEFLNTNILEIVKTEERIDEYRGSYAYTDFLITAYFLHQYDRLKREYKRRFNLEYQQVIVTQIVDKNQLLKYDPMQILSIKETSHRAFIIGMTNKVRLFTSDMQLLINPEIASGFKHYYDYAPFPFLDRIKL